MTAIILINFILPLPFLDYNYNLSPFLNELSLYIVLYFKCSHILYIVYSTQFSLLAAYCSNILIESIYLSLSVYELKLTNQIIKTCKSDT